MSKLLLYEENLPSWVLKTFRRNKLLRLIEHFNQLTNHIWNAVNKSGIPGPDHNLIFLPLHSIHQVSFSWFIH